jgi:uncharacterized protein YggT (Ycf19 family)
MPLPLLAVALSSVSSLLIFLLDCFQLCLIGRGIAFVFFRKSTSPIIYILEFITEPVLQKAREIIRPEGKMDLSGVFVFVVIEVSKHLLHHYF